MRYPPVLVAPSILSADFSKLNAELSTINQSGADWVHLDVMDGHFVPNITFGPKMVADLKRHSNLPFDVHLMIESPEHYVDQFIDAGADYVVFHIEAAVHAHRIIQRIRERGCKPGISIVPSTPVSTIVEVLPYVDQVLVMTVNPGFGGQSLIPTCVDKIRQLAKLKDELKLKYLINVDGGINADTAAEVRKAGADVLVSGSAFFKASDKVSYVSALRGEKMV